MSLPAFYGGKSCAPGKVINLGGSEILQVQWFIEHNQVLAFQGRLEEQNINRNLKKSSKHP